MRRTRRITTLLAVLVTAALVAPTALWASDRFDDVSDDNPFHDAINYLAVLGITQGCDDDQFCPGDNVTRQQMAGFLYRMLGRQDQDPTVNAAFVQGLEIYADHLHVTVDNEENNEEECQAQTSSLGSDINFESYTVTYQLFAVPEGEAEDFFPFDVNVSMRYTENVPASGDHLVCFATVDGDELPDGVYSVYRQETYDRGA